MHAMSAEPQSGKGWAALHASAERIAAGQHVVYVDYEDTAANIGARLVALSVEHDAILSRFHYLRPEDPVTPQDVDALAELQPALVVVDGVTEALALEALDMANNQDVADFYKRLARPFATAGAAVLLIDHVVKDREARGRYAIGAQHKLAGVDVAYRLDVAQPFEREMYADPSVRQHLERLDDEERFQAEARELARRIRRAERLRERALEILDEEDEDQPRKIRARRRSASSPNGVSSRDSSSLATAHASDAARLART